MASLWNALRSEVAGTMQDFREKGVIGALSDAALDTRDMAKDAGGWLWDGVKKVVDSDAEQAVVRSAVMPARGAKVPLELANGDVVEATVLEVDGVSVPPRVQVTYEGLEEPMLVQVLAPDAPFPLAPSAAGAQAAGNMLDSLKKEVNETVQDFREKGAVGAFKDAALDAVDIVTTTGTKAVDVVGSTAEKAATGARSLANDLIDMEWTPEASTEGAEGSEQQRRGSVRQLVEGLKQEIHGTVQEIREKGAVATFKDAALDAVDIVGSTASTAVSGARSVAAPLLEHASNLPDLWTGSSQGPAAETISGNVPSSSSSSPPAAAESPTSSAPASASSPPAASSPPRGEAAPAAPAAAAGSGYTAAPVPKAPVKSPPEESNNEQSDGNPTRKSLVSMRRNMFEKKEEPKKEEEEMID